MPPSHPSSTAPFDLPLPLAVPAPSRPKQLDDCHSGSREPTSKMHKGGVPSLVTSRPLPDFVASTPHLVAVVETASCRTRIAFDPKDAGVDAMRAGAPPFASLFPTFAPRTNSTTPSSIHRTALVPSPLLPCPSSTCARPKKRFCTPSTTSTPTMSKVRIVERDPDDVGSRDYMRLGPVVVLERDYFSGDIEEWSEGQSSDDVTCSEAGDDEMRDPVNKALGACVADDVEMVDMGLTEAIALVPSSSC
ncbi:hypothetical protein JCM10212_006152 [Sporobolomyces blumeae]